MKRNRKRRIVRLALGFGLVGPWHMPASRSECRHQTFSGSFRPTSLPKHSFAPVTGKVNLDITQGMQIPAEAANRDLDLRQPGQGQLQGAAGLPAGTAREHRSTGRPQGLRLVDHRHRVRQRQGDVSRPGTDRRTVGGDALQRSARGGNPQIIIHAYLTIPAPTTFIVPGVLRKIAGGKQQITFQVPPIAGGYGTLVHFDTTIGRKFKVHGHRQSYANAKCAKGVITLQGDFSYEDGTSNHTSFSAKCQGKK